jgi:hypothetical protein
VDEVADGSQVEGRAIHHMHYKDRLGLKIAANCPAHRKVCLQMNSYCYDWHQEIPEDDSGICDP